MMVFFEMQVRPMKLQTSVKDSQEIVGTEEVEPLMLLYGGTYSADASTTPLSRANKERFKKSSPRHVFLHKCIYGFDVIRMC